MKRIWYEDGSYIDVPADHAWEYENDPDWSRTESLPECGRSELTRYSQV